MLRLDRWNCVPAELHVLAGVFDLTPEHILYASNAGGHFITCARVRGGMRDADTDETSTTTSSRRWVLTHWLRPNQTPEGVLAKFRSLAESDLTRGGVGQIEGPNDEGRCHLQAYVELHRSARKSQMIGMMYRTTRWAVAKGDSESNERYCTKTHSEPYEWPDEKVMRLDGTEPVQFGEWGRRAQGKRTDLDRLKERLDAGASMSDVSSEFFSDFIRYSRGIQEYRRIQRQIDRQTIQFTALWGDTGTGKSTWARHVFPPSEQVFWLSKPNGSRCFWDGYDGHEVVVIDEFYGWLPYDFVLRLIDRGPLRVETKGGSVSMCATTFIFTSNTPPECWWNLESKPYGGSPWLRRIDEFGEVVECDSQFLQDTLKFIQVEAKNERDDTGATVEQS